MKYFKHYITAFFISTLLLSGCVTVLSEEDEKHEEEDKVEVVKRKKTVTACPYMVAPKLKGVPAAPRNLLRNVDPNDHDSMDRILTNYIVSLRKTIEYNNSVVRSAVKRNNGRCRKITY